MLSPVQESSIEARVGDCHPNSYDARLPRFLRSSRRAPGERRSEQMRKGMPAELSQVPALSCLKDVGQGQSGRLALFAAHAGKGLPGQALFGVLHNGRRYSGAKRSRGQI